MRRFGIEIGLAIMLLLILGGSALAQDAQPLPTGNNLLFMPDIFGRDPGPFVPVWVTYSGPCTEDHLCPGQMPGFLSHEKTVVDAGGRFIEVTQYMNVTEAKLGNPTFIYMCRVKDCVPHLKDASTATIQQSPASIDSKPAQFFVTPPVLPPPDVPYDWLARFSKWLLSQRSHLEIVGPGTMYITRAVSEGTFLYCANVGDTPKNAFNPAVMTVHFQITGIVDCWSTISNKWEKALMLTWTGVNGHENPGSDTNFNEWMTSQGLVLLHLADFRNWYYQFRFAGQDVLVWSDITSTQPEKAWYEIPDLGTIATFGGIASEVTRMIAWMATTDVPVALPFIDVIPSDASFTTFILPPNWECPRWYDSPWDLIGTPMCGTWGYGIPQ